MLEPRSFSSLLRRGGFVLWETREAKKVRRRLGAVGGQDPLLVAVGGERPFPWLLCPSHPSAGRGARALVSVGFALMVLWATSPTQQGPASSQLFFSLWCMVAIPSVCMVVGVHTG